MAGEEEAKKIVKKATKKVAEVTETGADAAKGALDAVGGLVGGIGKKAKAAASKAKDVAADVAGDAATVAKGAAGKAKKAAAAAAEKVGDVAEGALDAAKGAVDKVGDVVGDVAEDALGAAKGVADKVTDVAGDAVDAVGDLGKKGLGAAMGVLGGAAAMAGGLGKSVKEAAEKAVDAVGDVAEGAMDAAKGAVDKVGDVVGDVAEDALGAAKGVADKVTDVAGDAVGAVGDLGKKGVGAAVGAGAALLGGAAAVAGGLGDTAKDAVGAVTGENKDSGLLVPSLIGIAAIIGLAWFGYSKMGAKAPDTAPVAEASVGAPSWFAGIGDGLKATFPWLSLGFKGGAVVATGEAADKNAKDAALAEISQAVEASEGKGASVIDNITVKGSTETPLGAALAALGDNPDVAACGKAFTDTMAGRTINFASGKATISADSSALLGALTGIATACKAHNIEIGGHTDAQGEEAANQTLSQARADAVKAFWVEKGVPAVGLSAVGYGETKLLDTAEGAAADAKNRRTEFTVKEAAK